MSINKTEAASSAPETSKIRSLIMKEFAQWHANDGALETAIPGLFGEPPMRNIKAIKGVE